MDVNSWVLLDCWAGKLALCGSGKNPQTQRCTYWQLEVCGELKRMESKGFGQGIDSACYRAH